MFGCQYTHIKPTTKASSVSRFHNNLLVTTLADDKRQFQKEYVKLEMTTFVADVRLLNAQF